MSHEEQRDRLLDLAYGELPPRDARELEEHAGTCEACRVELGRIRATRGLMSSLPEEAAPEAGRGILVAAAREAVRRREPRRAVPRWLWGGSVLAASVAVVVLFSLRVANVAPPPAGREDPDALLGEGPWARPPAPAPGTPPAAAPADAGAPPPGRAGAPPERLAESAPKRPERRYALRQESRPESEERRAAPRSERAFATPPPPAAPPAAAADAGAREESRIAAVPPGPTPDASASRVGTLPAPSAAPAAPLRRAPGGRAAAKAEAPPAPQEEDAPRAAGAAAPSRRDELRASGRLRVEVREFPGCDAELLRRIERDPAGAIVGYSWEARVGERRVRYEVVYADDGSPLRARAVDAATGEPQRGSFRAPSAGELDLAAPSRCAR